MDESFLEWSEGKNIYEMAKILHFLDPLHNTLESYLADSLQLAISYYREENKLNCLGEDAYLDYKLYKKKFQKKEFEEFLDEAYDVVPFSNDLTYEQKYGEFKEGFEELNEINRDVLENWIISKKLQKTYFPIEDFENYLKAF